MNPDTGEILRFSNDTARKFYEERTKTKLVPLTEKQANQMKPLSNRERKRLLAGYPCPCGSGKNFKKCCIKKYGRRI
jgi:hypothetical protein